MGEINRQWVLVKRSAGTITTDCFEFREAPLSEPGDGQVLVHGADLSCGPARRAWMDLELVYMPRVAIGEIMRASGAAGATRRWHAEGSPVTRLDEAEGVESAPGALVRLVRGENLGKQVIRLE